MEFLVVAGSYERLLYGLEGHRASPSEDLVNREFELKSAFIFPAHTGSIKCTASGSDRFLASGSVDELIRLFDLKKRRELGTLMKHEGSVTCLEFFQESHLLSGSEDGTLAIWRSSGWECLKVLKGHTGRINAIAIHPSGKFVMSVSQDCTLRIWDLLKGHQAACKRLPYEADSVFYSPDGAHFCLLSKSMIQIFSSGGDAAVFMVDNKAKKYISAAFYGNQHLALGSEDAFIDIYEFSVQKKQIITISGHQKRIRCLSGVQLKDSTYLFSASTDGMIRGWNLSKYINNSIHDDDITKLDASHCITQYNANVRLTCLTTISTLPTPIRKEPTTATEMISQLKEKISSKRNTKTTKPIRKTRSAK